MIGMFAFISFAIGMGWLITAMTKDKTLLMHQQQQTARNFRNSGNLKPFPKYEVKPGNTRSVQQFADVEDLSMGPIVDAMISPEDNPETGV
jgi:hypothetical protein